MRKNIQYQFGVSLFALAFSLVGADEAWGQTCVTPPSCDALGFTKTAADCAGKTILKCPFDTSKVYCPGAEEQEVTKTYNLGDTYYSNGVPVGKVISVSNCQNGGGGSMVASSVGECARRHNCTAFTYKYTYGLPSPYEYRIVCTRQNNQNVDITIGYSSDSSLNSPYFSCFLSGSTGVGTDCKNGQIVMTGMRMGTFSEANKTCATMNNGGLSWYLPSFVQMRQARTYLNATGEAWINDGTCFKKEDSYGIDMQGVIRCDSSNNPSCKAEGEGKICPTGTDPVLNYTCVASF